MVFNYRTLILLRLLLITLLSLPGAFGQTPWPVKWEEVYRLNNTSSSPILNDVHFLSESNIMVVGISGKILRSVDKGATWEYMNSGTAASLHSICVIDSFNAVAVGNGGIIIRTEDSGSTWETVMGNENYNLYSVKFVDTSTGFAVGGTPSSYNHEKFEMINHPSKVLKTVDGGRTWKVIGNSFEGEYNDVFFITSQIGYAVGGKYFSLGSQLVLAKTTDGGTTWLDMVPADLYGLYPECALQSVYFINEMIGFAGASNGILLKTVNGGDSWLVDEKLYRLSPENIFDLHFFSDTLGMAAYLYHVIITDSKAEHGWTPQTESEATLNRLTSLHFLEPRTGYAVCSSGRIIKYIGEDIVTKNESKLSQTIKFDLITNKSLEEGIVELKASASSGLIVTFRATGPVSLQGTYLHFLDTGVVTVSAIQEGNDNYSPAEAKSHSFSITQNDPTGDRDTPISEWVNFHPNPVTNHLNLNLDSRWSGGKINVFDYSGAAVHDQAINSTKLQLNLRNLRSGLYIINVSKGRYYYNFKIIKT